MDERRVRRAAATARQPAVRETSQARTRPRPPASVPTEPRRICDKGQTSTTALIAAHTNRTREVPPRADRGEEENVIVMSERASAPWASIVG